MKNIQHFANQADFIIQTCGGIKVLCEWTGEPYHVVRGWIHRSVNGCVPPEHYPTIILKARENGIDLSERDLVFPPLAGSIQIDPPQATSDQNATECV